MTMADFEDLSAYWRDHPPPHILIAGYMGFKPQSRTEPQADLITLLGADPEMGGPMRFH